MQLIEHPTARRLLQENFRRYSGQSLPSLLELDPAIIRDFRGAKFVDKPPTKNPKIFSVESPFSTAKLHDLVVAENPRPSDEQVLAIATLGMSFLKPARSFSADLVYARDNISLLADGASLVAKKEDHNFPKQLCEIYTTPQGVFAPDVLWSTVVAKLIGKTCFESPFVHLAEAFVNTPELATLKTKLHQETDPKSIIVLLNEAIGIVLKQLTTDIQPTEENKIFYPSGVMAVVNPNTLRYAYTGDVRIGVTIDDYNNVHVINTRFAKVTRHDAAALEQDSQGKQAFAIHRASEIGNIQGLPIRIESAYLRKPHISNHLMYGAIAMWTDGSELVYPTPEAKKFLFAPDTTPKLPGNMDRNAAVRLNPDISVSGTLIARDPLLYHLYLLHQQNVFVNKLENETKYAQKGVKVSQKWLNRINAQPPWRADDASSLVMYLE